MSHFNLKSLAFYGTAIGSVVILFQVVSVYGESNLKAPLAIGGRYRINAKNLPGCLKSDSLLLDLQQSGIYVNAFLLPGDNPTKSEATVEEKPSLTGKWNNQKLSLSGTLPQLTACQDRSVNIQGILEKQTLKGQISLSSVPKPLKFTAQREIQPSQNENPSH